MPGAPKKKPQRRTQSERREAAEEALLQAAISLISRRGVRQTTLADVGEAAGYSGGITAHYFKTKDRLFQEAAKYMHARYAELLAAKQRARGLDTIEAMIDMACETPNVDHVRAQFLMQKEAFRGASGIRDVFKAYNQDALTRIRSELEIGIKNKEIRGDIDPKAQAVVLLGLIRAARFQWLIGADQLDFSKMRRELLAFVHRSLVLDTASRAARTAVR